MVLLSSLRAPRWSVPSFYGCFSIRVAGSTTTSPPKRLADSVFRPIPPAGRRAHLRSGQGVRRVSVRQASAGQDPSLARGPGRPAHLRYRLRPSRLQRRRPSRRRPIHKLLLDRDPVSGERLASQPTLSRLENAVDHCALYRMADELATRVIEPHRRRLDGRARCITI